MTVETKSRKKEAHSIILAAGMGTRMKSKRSKVLHEVSGLPMIEIVLRLAREVSKKITVIVSEENQKEINVLLKEGEKSIIQKERLGTGHAVNIALESIMQSDAEKVLILYGDTPLVRVETLEDIINKNNDVTFLGFINQDSSNKYGRLVTEGEKLIEIIEFKDATDEQRQISICNSGVVCVERNFIIDAINKLEPSNVTGEYYLTDIAHIANSQSKKCGFILCSENEVIGVNSREDLFLVDSIMQERIKKIHMQNGVTFLLPQTIYVHLDAKIEKDVLIEQGCFIGKSVEIKEDVTVRAFSHLEGCILESGVIVGPFARIRPKSFLDKNARVGNFVEVKNAKIGKDSKANHLAYLGDVTVEEGCNIGAGTIFCNYNGFEKFHSNVGKGSFIGSNSTIVSPVNVASGTIIGAGSVIVSSTQEDTLVIARAKEISIIGGGKKFRDKKKK